MSSRIRIGVLRGGPSAEYDVSLKSGAAVLNALREHHDHEYDAHDIFIDKQGIWHMDGRAFSPESARARFDLAWNALHGAYGEDGKIQAILEAHGIPFTGSDSLSSAVAMNKILTKQAVAQHDIKSPYWKEVLSNDVDEDPTTVASVLFKSFVLPAIVKPASSGSSVGISIVRNHPELVNALIEAAKHGHSILIEELISGIEATCGVIEGFRGEELYALPPIEIVPPKESAFYDYNAKYVADTKLVCPGNFSQKIKQEIERLSKSVHKALGLRHYSRSDFIIHPRRGIYFLEVNTLPGLTEHSNMPTALRAVGSSLPEFVGHVIGLASND